MLKNQQSFFLCRANTITLYFPWILTSKQNPVDCEFPFEKSNDGDSVVHVSFKKWLCVITVVEFFRTTH